MLCADYAKEYEMVFNNETSAYVAERAAREPRRIRV